MPKSFKALAWCTGIAMVVSVTLHAKEPKHATEKVTVSAYSMHYDLKPMAIDHQMHFVVRPATPVLVLRLVNVIIGSNYKNVIPTANSPPAGNYWLPSSQYQFY
jgi:hypothetical protein